MVAQVLHNFELILDTALPGSLPAENVACLLTDLRVQCCHVAGASDPCPHRPMSPRFPDTILNAPARLGTWPEEF